MHKTPDRDRRGLVSARLLLAAIVISELACLAVFLTVVL